MLNKVVIFVSLIFANAWFNFIMADELSTSSPEINPKHNLSICAIFKNEAKYLDEWIEYHRSIGVDHFYLYNIGSKDPFRLILKPYIKEGVVTLVNWPEAIDQLNDKRGYRWALSTQIPAYENAVNFIARDETKWLVFLDVNEYLVCTEEKITDLLKKYDDHSGIVIQSLEPTSPSVILFKKVEKMIFKPVQCEGFNWPPYRCRLKPSQTSTEVDRFELRIFRNKNHKKNDELLYEDNKKYKFSPNYRLKLDADSSDIFEENDGIDDQALPIYQQVPNFLKKLKREQNIQ